MIIRCRRYHDFSCGHRVVGHENKCKNLHGHNYRVYFTVEAPQLDGVGRVVDFSVIKSTLCQYLEDVWDHRMVIYHEDPLAEELIRLDPEVVLVSFNPTAENMAAFLLNVIGPAMLPEPLKLVHVRVDETRKCGAEALL